ncbi:dCTP deaminase domain-containing protein [Priestia megaterium]|uniref:dCTP deaminase domain-containing protein n=1 Tax=Priestia megaterium TaxID=1404 RepID=UPI00119E4AD5|nr:hypothetical protein [Priestia megaterium]
MAIIPFILDGPHKNIVRKQQDFDLSGTNIQMNDIDEDQLTGDSEANTSYDLKIGDVYLDHRESKPSSLSERGKIKLTPGAAVIIQTKEFVHFPKTRFGQIVPKVGLLRKGISNTTSKIDPGYSGRLLITLFNLGKNTIHLEKGEKFCTLIVHDVSAPGVKHYDKPPKELQADPEIDLLTKFKDFITGPYWGFASVIATLIIAVLAIIFQK